MAVVTISGGPGAPGATSTALALLLAWPLEEGRRVLLLECDPDGGAVLAGALEGRLEAGYGLRHLAVADRRGRLAETLWAQLIDVSPKGTGDRLLLPGLTDPAQAAGLAYTWAPLAAACQDLDAHGCDVLIDLGRSGAHGASAALARRADAALVVVRSTLRGISGVRPRVTALGADLDAEGTGADALGVVLIQEGPYSPSEVTKALGGPPVLGLLPYEPRSARVLSDGGDSGDRRFVRSALMRAARTTADEVRLLTARRRLRLAPAASGPAAAAAAPPMAPPPYPASTPETQGVPTPPPPPSAPLAGFAPRPPSPQAFRPQSNGAGPGQEVARVR